MRPRSQRGLFQWFASGVHLNWTSGYVSQIDYTFGYYPELNPIRSRLAFLQAGYKPSSGFETCCELGFGQGLSINTHAAALGGQWWGTDFNPSQVNFGLELSEASKANIHLFDEAFEHFCNRADLPDFDFIALHGVWSWVSKKNRKILLNFVRNRLKVGGTLYISYNTLPGWASFLPVRELANEIVKNSNRIEQDMNHNINDAIAFTEALLAADPRYTKGNPSVIERFKTIKGLDRRYIAHEFLNQDWNPMTFNEISASLNSAKLSYVSSANYLDHVDILNYSIEQKTFLSKIENEKIRESVRDLIVNQSFRKEYWVKGRRIIDPLEKIEAIRRERICLICHPSQIEFKAKGHHNEANLDPKMYNILINIILDYRPISLGELEIHLARYEINFSQMLQMIFIMIGKGYIAVSQHEKIIEKQRKSSNSLNSYILNASRSSEKINLLATPVVGGAVPIDRMSQLFALSILDGKKASNEWAEFAWRLLKGQGQKLVKDGKPIENDEEALKEMEKQANLFEQLRLPVLRALCIL